MKRNFVSRAIWTAPLLALAATLTPGAPALAQEVAPVPTPNADKLADEMRVLAREPRNLRALLSAGELSARLNDASAAAGFFARAQAIEPGNPRVTAGQAMVMVRMERPGEALRLFDLAARAGVDMTPYASDRGLAYDLIGAQAHAQREHRIAMRLNDDDDTRRRYALSLGISGDRAQAEAVLDPLVRRSDRAAWRARAFILAMNGDAAGADQIAASMMGGFGSALSPFFRRLPSLSAADKAFAVHFGELQRTPARIADASVAPPLPTLPREPGVAVAAAQPARNAPAARDQRAQATPADTRRTSRSTPARGTSTREQAQPVRGTSLAERRAAEREQRELRDREAREAQQREAQRLAKLEADRIEAQRQADLRAQQTREAQAARQRETERLAAEQAAREAEAQRLAQAQAQQRAAAEAARLAEAERAAQAAAATTPAAVTPAVTPAASQPTQVASAPPPPPAPALGREDNVIARIIAGITIPASELGVEPMPGERRAEPETPPVQVAQAQPQVQPDRLPSRIGRVAPTLAASTRSAAEEKKLADAKAAEKKAADAKAAAKKAADAKIAAEKAAQAKAKAAEAAKLKAEPSRIWVQVAGGANVGDLPKAWRALVAKAPAEFRGKQAFTTPLRFTNRLLTGPFKTQAQAQAFVNAIGKKGLSSFAFTSTAGQKIDKLPTN